MTTFKALVVAQKNSSQLNGKCATSLQELDLAALPPGEVLVRIAYSSLNYKDGLALTGKPGVIRTYPMVPGIDLAGVVEESGSLQFKRGDEVVVTGCGTSETFWGSYAQWARLDAEFIVPVPKGISLKQAMGVGTAGFTAMQSVMALEQHGLKPGGRKVIVTGAAGGVGSTAVAILNQLGYQVAASTGRPELGDYLRMLGAHEIVDRATLTIPSAAPSIRPLETERWAAAIDNVGGDTLASLLRAMSIGGSIASCGVAGGAAFSATVFPFILRGVNILGIDTLRVTKAQRLEIWQRIARDLPMNLLDEMIQVESLGKVCELGEQILAGKIRGRIVIDVNA